MKLLTLPAFAFLAAAPLGNALRQRSFGSLFGASLRACDCVDSSKFRLLKNVIVTSINIAREAHPEGLLPIHFNETFLNSLPEEGQERLLRCVASGAVNRDADVGAYAMHPSDYADFETFFDPLIRAYHKIDSEVHHVTDWTIKGGSGIPENGVLDLRTLGLKDPISMRVRVGRNSNDFPLPGAMTRDDRLKMEEKMVAVFEELMADPAYGGNYYSLTPSTNYSVNDKEYNELVSAHLMFKDMANDRHLSVAGIASDWPYGRGAYVSADKGFIVWIGEEDHFRIMCMKKGHILNDVFDRLKTVADLVEKKVGKFAHSEKYGYLTSCPSNLGTGMRASVHIKVPNLTASGSPDEAKKICKPFGLSVRGLGGEHTPVGADGTIDISPSARLMITEGEILTKLYQGISFLLEKETKLESGEIHEA